MNINISIEPLQGFYLIGALIAIAMAILVYPIINQRKQKHTSSI